MRRRQFLKWLGVAPVAAIVAPKAALALLTPEPTLAVVPKWELQSDGGFLVPVDFEREIQKSMSRAMAESFDREMVHGTGTPRIPLPNLSSYKSTR